jgi:Ca2+-binding RTX toxin-like protein
MRKETLAKMSTIKLAHISSLLLLFILVLGPTIGGQAWADNFEGTEGPDIIIGTLEDDEIDSKGGKDRNFGDAGSGDASGDDDIDSGDGDDRNVGDTGSFGSGSGDDKIVSGDGDDNNVGDSSFHGSGSGDDDIDSGDGDDMNVGDADQFGSGDDKIITGQGNDQLTGGGGADILVCGSGEDTVTDYNPDEGDIVTPDCENVS